MAERRLVPRQRTFFKGVLSFNNGNSSEDCLVRNLSDAGAQVELPHPNAPAAFDLIVPGREMRQSARTVWRIGGRIGLAFEGAHAAAPARTRRPTDDLRY